MWKVILPFYKLLSTLFLTFINSPIRFTIAEMKKSNLHARRVQAPTDIYRQAYDVHGFEW